MVADRLNTQPLWAESVTSHGAALTQLAKTAPAPSATMMAGKTQQISVPLAASKLIPDQIICALAVFSLPMAARTFCCGLALDAG